MHGHAPGATKEGGRVAAGASCTQGPGRSSQGQKAREARQARQARQPGKAGKQGRQGKAGRESKAGREGKEGKGGRQARQARTEGRQTTVSPLAERSQAPPPGALSDSGGEGVAQVPTAACGKVSVFCTHQNDR